MAHGVSCTRTRSLLEVATSSWRCTLAVSSSLLSRRCLPSRPKGLLKLHDCRGGARKWRATQAFRKCNFVQEMLKKVRA
eukprot:1185350-Prorocentrum_minimum.AAC.2